jgi:GNAT superfamily N-acetyltransferase
MKIDPANVSCRTARDEDRTFAFAVKKAALRSYVEAIWGWDEAVQVEFHRRDWEERRPDVIRLLDRDIGTIEIWRRDEDIHLGEFYIFPEFQKHGIGSELMTRLVSESDSRSVPIRLEVIKINPVQSLYLRFGFRVLGETKTHFRMEKMPNQSQDPTRTGRGRFGDIDSRVGHL